MLLRFLPSFGSDAKGKSIMYNAFMLLGLLSMRLFMRIVRCVGWHGKLKGAAILGHCSPKFMTSAPIHEHI